MSWTARGGLVALSTAAVLGAAGVTVALADESSPRRIDTTPLGAVDPATPAGLAVHLGNVRDAVVNHGNQVATEAAAAAEARQAAQRAVQERRRDVREARLEQRREAREARVLAARAARAQERREDAQEQQRAAAAPERTTSSPLPVRRVGPDRDDEGRKHEGRPGRGHDRRVGGDDHRGRHRGWDRDRDDDRDDRDRRGGRHRGGPRGR